MPIRTLLIANRGEIAQRVMRTASALGMRTVAVFSDADADMPFVRQADLAVRLPGVTPGETYLRGDVILDAARRTDADAIHPGYGFLSENAEFARQCARAGVIFVGPDPRTIEEMGSKIRSKEIMAAAGVPVLPSATITGGESEAEIVELAVGIGFPLLVKASAGGGGRGMRLVGDRAEVAAAVASARREAGSAFGDDAVFLERFVRGPRHVEVQIFGDRHGDVIHLFERDCSIQRRYQKIVEESPSPAVDEDLRSRLGKAAVAAGRALGYTGAGTVEFVLGDDGEFHFLEVNTRLQVEHPVTEFVTGLDLVRLQLDVAQGMPLSVAAREPRMNGAAIEVRLYAEDPFNDFLPTAGVLREFEIGEGVRVDAGVECGSRVSIHYDSLLAKLIAHAPTRIQAVDALLGAVRGSRIHGLKTNRELLIGILTEPEFRSGSTDTAYLDRHPPSGESAHRGPGAKSLAAAAMALLAHHRQGAKVQTSIPAGFRNVRSQPSTVFLKADERQFAVEYTPKRTGTDSTAVEITVDGKPLGETLCEIRGAKARTGGDSDRRVYEVALEIDGLRASHTVGIGVESVDVSGADGAWDLVFVDPLPEPGNALSPGSLAAPMPGSVARLEAAEGEVVVEGQVIAVLEAMKMEHAVRAPIGGTLKKIRVAVGDQVEIGQELATVDAEDPS